MRSGLSVLFLLTMSTSSAHAHGCTNYVANVTDFLTTNPQGPGTYTFNLTMATITAFTGEVTYGQGVRGDPVVMRLVKPHIEGAILFPASLEGIVQVYSSRRRWNGNPIHPFAPTETSLEAVTILLGPLSTAEGSYAPGTVMFKASSSPSTTKQHFTPSCENGLMRGFMGQTEVVLSLDPAFSQNIH